MPRITFHPATADRWSDVEKLFGPRGACAGCWCMWPRVRGGDFRRNSGEPNKRALRALVRSGAEPGILAYVDGEPAGWCALAPRENYARIVHSRLFRDHAETPAWSVVCFFVPRAHRGRGLTKQLLEAAARYAKQHGAVLLEGYPIDPLKGRTADAFVWTGLASAFRAAGFAEVARPSPTRPLMRRVLAGASSGRRAGVAKSARRTIGETRSKQPSARLPADAAPAKKPVARRTKRG